jgi:hypothetical protein
VGEKNFTALPQPATTPALSQDVCWRRLWEVTAAEKYGNRPFCGPSEKMKKKKHGHAAVLCFS